MITNRDTNVRRRSVAATLLAAVACWSAAATLPCGAADDVVVEPEAEKDPLAGFLEILAEKLVLAWKDGRLAVDVPATQAAIFGPDFMKERIAVRQTLGRARNILVDEAVAQGLPRDKAEALFGRVRELLESNLGRRGFGGLDDSQAEIAATCDAREMPPPAEVVETAFDRALSKASKDGLLPRLGRSSSSGSGDGRETTHERGPFTLHMRFKNNNLLKVEASTQDRSFLFDLREEPRLSLTLGTTADPEGQEGDFVRLSQTDTAFRVKHLRDGKEIMKLEAESFRDCCLANPDAVRRDLVPLLRRLGVRPPAMPDDAAVKTEVVARLRRAAGKEPPGQTEEVAAAAVEVRRQRIAQMSAVIDAFKLLDDPGYLRELKQAASPEDAGVIEAHLAAIAAAAGSGKP